MSLLHFFFIVCLFWILVIALDNLLKTSRRTKNIYLTLLEDYGLYLSFGYFRFYTLRLNKLFSRVERWPPRLLHLWFTVGTFVGIITMFSSVVLLSLNLVGYFRSSSSEDHVLVPVVPGVNLPWNQVFLYMVVLLLLAVMHEAGHAIAAVSEQVRLNGFAVFLFLLYPGAYVDLQSDHLKLISPKRQLKIYCAGSWHNIIIALAALALLHYQPLLLSPFYSMGKGVSVTSVAKDSVMKDKLLVGTRITGVNYCPISNSEDWVQCMTKVIREPQWGYCASVYMLELQKSVPLDNTEVVDGIRECCDQKLSATHVCFYIAPLPTPEPSMDKTHTDDIPTKDASHGTSKDYKCLAARPVTSALGCHGPRDCTGVPKQTCIFPTVDNSTKLVRIQHSHDVDAIFFGDPRILFMSVTVSDYEPRTSLFWLQFPGILEAFLVYCVSLSGALAILNMLPTFALDGQWTFMAFVDEYLKFCIESPESKSRLYTAIFTTCLCLLLLNIVIALYTVL